MKDPHIALRPPLQWPSSLATPGIARGALKAPEAGGPRGDVI